MFLFSLNGTCKKKQAINEDDALGQARDWVNEGVQAYERNDFETAIFMIRKAESSRLEWKDDLLLFKCYYLLGSSFKKRAKFVLAEDYLHKALSIPNVPENHLSAIFNLLGNINSYNGLFKKGVAYHRKSLAIRKKLNDGIGLAETHNNLADLYIRTAQADSAHYYLLQSWSFKKKNSKTKGFYYLNLARILKMKSNYLEARDTVQRAISLFDKNDESDQKAYAFVQAAEIHINLSQYTIASYYLDSAKEMNTKRKDKDLLYEILLREQDVFKKSGLLLQALDKAAEAAELRDSLLNETKLRTIAELETVYEFGELNHSLERQKEALAINRLEIRNRKLQIFALALLSILVGTIALWAIRRNVNNRKSKREKEKLLYELNHRVKNNLSSLAGALVIQKTNSQNDETREALSDVLHRIDAISTIHEVLAYSSTVEEENPELWLDQILKDLTERLVAGSIHRETVNVELILEECTIDLKSSLPLAMIANELITNALKYAFKGDGPHSLKVELREDNGSVILIVRDSGQGMLTENWENGKTTGMVLIRELAKQLHGHCEFVNDKGLVFSLKMKKGR